MAGEACQPFGAGQRLRSRLPFSVGPLKRAVESSWCSHQHSVGKCMHPKKNNMTVLEIRYKCVSIPKENANLVATLPAQQSERLRSARGSSGQWKSVGPTESHSPASDALHVPKQSSPQPPTSHGSHTKPRKLPGRPRKLSTSARPPKTPHPVGRHLQAQRTTQWLDPWWGLGFGVWQIPSNI